MTTTRTIFPRHSFLNTEYEIFKFLDDYTLIALSKVNHIANQSLSNEFFKERFKNLYPFFGKWNPFRQLQACRPQNCWKIICCVFSNKFFPNFKPSFIEEDIQMYRDFLKSEKSRKEKRLQEICGFCGEDLAQGANGKILAEPQKLQERSAWRGCRLRFLFPPSIHSDEELERVYDWLELHAEELDQIETMPDEELGELNRDFISQYRASMDLIGRDPRSAIEQALKADIEMREELQNLQREADLQVSKVKLLFPTAIYSDKELASICDWLKLHGEALFSNRSDAEIINMKDEELGRLDRRFISQYRLLMECIHQRLRLYETLKTKATESGKLHEDYCALEGERIEIQSEIASLDKEISRKPLYVNSIEKDWKFLKKFQSMNLVYMPILKECSDFIHKMLASNKVTVADFAHLHNQLIPSLHVEDQQSVVALCSQYAVGFSKDQRSEKQFLLQLRAVVNDRLKIWSDFFR